MVAVRRSIGTSLTFKPAYLAKVLNSRKTVTIRWGIVKPLHKSVLIECNGLVYGRALIRRYTHLRFSELLNNDALASRDGFANAADMVNELRRIYPFVKESDWVTVIEFEVVERLKEPVPKLRLIKNAPRAAREALSRGAYRDPSERLALASVAAGGGILDTIESTGVPLSRVIELLTPFGL